MKKTLLGIGLILFAAYVLLRDSLALPSLEIPIWTLIFVIGFGFNALQSLLRRDYMSAYICGVIAFIFLENHYDWLIVGTGTLILAAVLAGIGFSLVWKPKRRSATIKIKEKSIGEHVRDRVFEQVGEKGSDYQKSDSDTIFGSKTRYINGDFVDVSGDTVFASTVIYFDNALILGDKGAYSGDAVFSSVKLYVPQDWSVEFVGDQVFSNIKAQPSGMPAEKQLIVTGDFVFSSLEVIYI